LRAQQIRRSQKRRPGSNADLALSAITRE